MDGGAARALYEKAVKQAPKSVQVWIDYISFEKLQVNLNQLSNTLNSHPECTSKCRAIYKRALQQRHLDDKDRLTKEILKFELQFGDPQSYYDYRDRVKHQNFLFQADRGSEITVGLS